jgi:hypothetical protein
MAAVAQAGEPVVKSQVADAPLGLPQGGNIGEGHDAVGDASAFIKHRGHMLPGRKAAAIAPHAHHLGVAGPLRRSVAQQFAIGFAPRMQKGIRMAPPDIVAGPAGEPGEEPAKPADEETKKKEDGGGK